MSSRRPRRWLRRLIVTVVILGCLAVGIDWAAKAVAENQLATIAQNEAAQYDVRAAGTKVEIGGFGFLPQLARGELTRITLTMDQPTIESIPAEDVTVVMSGIQIPREILTGNTSAPVTVDTTDMRLRLSPQELTRLAVRTTGLKGVSLRIVGSKLQARVSALGVQADATVRPQVKNGRIVLAVDDLADTPSAVRDAVTSLLADGIVIPELPFDASLKQVAVDGTSIVLIATAANLKLNA